MSITLPPLLRGTTKHTFTSLSGVEDVDVVILSHIDLNILGTLMRKMPDHPLLAPNSRMWYERIIMTLSNDISLPPPYQLDREDLSPTDYRSLWYTLTSSSYLNYTTMTTILADHRPYGIPTSSGKNVIEAALDATAIHTDDDGAPYRWSEAIIVLLSDHIVQCIHQGGALDDTIEMSEGGRLPYWVMSSIASRGCIQLIKHLSPRLGKPVSGLTTAAWAAGRWILDALSHTPELFVLGTPSPIPSRYPTITAHTILALWDAYVGETFDVVQEAINADDNALNTIDENDVVAVMDTACRDVDLLVTVMDVMNALDMVTDGAIQAITVNALNSPYRDVDDYSTIRILLGWYSETLRSTLGNDNAIHYYISNEMAPEIPYYYATRIRTREQSRHFASIGIATGPSKIAIRMCHNIFSGSLYVVHKSIAKAEDTKFEYDIVDAIVYVRIYLAGMMAADGPPDGIHHAIGLLKSREMKTLMELTTLPNVRDNYAAVTSPLNLLVTASRNMDVLKVAYSLFTFGASGAAIRKVREYDPEQYSGMLVDLSHIAHTLFEIARDHDSADGALPWLIDRISPTIPHSMTEWKGLVRPHASTVQRPRHLPFPRRALWDDFISRAIQIPLTNYVPYGRDHIQYVRLRELIGFATIPSGVSATTADSISSGSPMLPSMDLRREVDGGLPVPVVVMVAEAMIRSHVRPISVITTYKPPFVWEPLASQALRDATSALKLEKNKLSKGLRPSNASPASRGSCW